MHGRIVTLKGKLGPLPHLRLCVLHFPAAKVKVSDLRVILLYHILVLFSLFFVMGKTDPHSLAAGNRFLNALPQHLPVQIDLNSQAGADIQHLFFRTVLKTVKMQLLRLGQRIYLTAPSRFHSSHTPFVNARSISFLTAAS